MTPYALRAVLNHAEDAYLGGNTDYTAALIDGYRPILDRVLLAKKDKTAKDEAADPQAASFSSLSLEMASIKTRISNNLDYFGHPAGWVPELSFDASLTGFTNEVDEAIHILYLAYYVEESSSDHDRHVASLKDTVTKLQDDVTKSAAEYNTAQIAIPKLATSAADLAQDISLYQEKVEIRENELMAQAQQTVGDSHNVPFWKQALNTLSAAAQVFPIGQPVVGSVGKGLNILASVGQDTPLETLQQVGSLASDFNEANIKQSVANYHSEIAELDPSNAKNAKDYAIKLMPYMQKLASGYKVVDESLTSHQAPASEVMAEFAQLEASDTHFNDLVQGLESSWVAGKLASRGST